jgi:hypothetical protein
MMMVHVLQIRLPSIGSLQSFSALKQISLPNFDFQLPVRGVRLTRRSSAYHICDVS